MILLKFQGAADLAVDVQAGDTLAAIVDQVTRAAALQVGLPLHPQFIISV